MFTPFSLQLNISSFETVENLASAGAVPVVLASSANTGLASSASEAVSSAIFFMFSSSALSHDYNARRGTVVPRERLRCGALCFLGEPRQQRFRRIVRQQRCDGHERLRTRVTFAVAGVAHHGGQPPRDHVGVAQIGFGKGNDDRTVVLDGAEISLAHQA